MCTWGKQAKIRFFSISKVFFSLFGLPKPGACQLRTPSLSCPSDVRLLYDCCTKKVRTTVVQQACNGRPECGVVGGRQEGGWWCGLERGWRGVGGAWERCRESAGWTEWRKCCGPRRITPWAAGCCVRMWVDQLPISLSSWSRLGVMMISVRRLMALLAGLSLATLGANSPWPQASMRAGLMPGPF